MNQMNTKIKNIDNISKLSECIGINAVAFVGAGLAKPLGYRTWKEGIFSDDKKNPGLLKIARKTHEDLRRNRISPDDLPSVIDFCKGDLPKYNEFLISEFGSRKEIDQAMHINLLWQINFKHIMTTNFDPSLYDTGRFFQLNEVITFPHRDVSLTDNRTLVYIHGRAFLIDKDKEPLTYFLSNLIYGRNSYVKAYDVKKEIELFIYELLKKYNLIFLGFSMDDEDFKRMFGKIITAKNAHEEDLSERYGNEFPHNQIFLIADEDELYEPIKTGKIKTNKKKIDSLIEMGINVIPFKKKENYKELTILLTKLKNRIPYVKFIAKERTIIADVKDASKRKDLAL